MELVWLGWNQLQFFALRLIAKDLNVFVKKILIDFKKCFVCLVGYIKNNCNFIVYILHNTCNMDWLFFTTFVQFGSNAILINFNPTNSTSQMLRNEQKLQKMVFSNTKFYQIQQSIPIIQTEIFHFHHNHHSSMNYQPTRPKHKPTYLPSRSRVQGCLLSVSCGKSGRCLFFDCLQFRKSLNIMSVLKQKLDKAAEQFQIHNFKQSLALYEDCLAFCYRTRESQSIIYNIMTAKGALLGILGELDKAMATLNEVIKGDSSHYLGLIRRSQVFKKRGKLNRALKDLEMVATFCPDNLQIAAMRIEIENMKSKSKSADSSESESDQQELDQDMQLNFSNLKKIDRKSCSIVLNQAKDSKGRKSRVTITGEEAVEYERQDDGDKSFNSTQVSKEQLKEKYSRISKEIEMQKDVPAPASKIVVKPNNRSKSILKNKSSGQGILQVQTKESHPVRESKFVDKLKNIDGKIITSNHSIQTGSNKNLREVEFRKSLFNSQEKEFGVSIVVDKPAKQGRKSCLKNPSFELQEVKQKAVRRSKFQMLSRKSIDGAVLKKRKSIDEIKQLQGDKGRAEQDSDGGSSYNIFGSNDNVEISKEIKEKLGITSDQPKEKKPAKPRANGGKSILKKNSVLMHVGEERVDRGQSSEVKETSEEKVAKKPKKSVMFSKSRFAE